MPTGKISKWNADRGFGFIIRDDGEADIFAHIKNVNADVDALQSGQLVTFEVGNDQKHGKAEARNVRLG